jgi:hypothetical protein
MSVPIYVDLKHEFVASSAIRAVGYDTNFGVLYVQFLNETVSSYRLSDSHYYQIITAASAGSYYNVWLKGKPTWAAPQHDARLVLRNAAATPTTTGTVQLTNNTDKTLAAKYTVTVKFNGELNLNVDADTYGKATEKVDTFLKDFVVSGSYEVINIKKV